MTRDGQAVAAASAPARPPRLGRVVWRMAWTAALAGIAVAVVLAIAGVGFAAEGPELFLSLLPAVLTIGPLMGLAPLLFAVLGLAVVVRPPRTQRHEQWAAGLGAVLGAFISPAMFYPASLGVGLAVGTALGATLAVVYSVTLGRMWAADASARAISAPPHP